MSETNKAAAPKDHDPAREATEKYQAEMKAWKAAGRQGPEPRLYGMTMSEVFAADGCAVETLACHIDEYKERFEELLMELENDVKETPDPRKETVAFKKAMKQAVKGVNITYCALLSAMEALEPYETDKAA